MLKSGQWMSSAALPRLTGTAALMLAAGVAQAAQPKPELALSPLSGSANIHPNVLLSLSLDHTASRAAYPDADGTYDRTREYIGYFNPRKCYAYRGGARNVTSGYFSIQRDADAMHECSGSFSGNFMNWAAGSMLDVLRYALTGGDRIYDTPESTILQRALLSRDAYADAHYFPRKSLQAGGNASAPNRVTPFNVDALFVVSCRNRILFSDVQGSSVDCDASAFDDRGKLARTDKRLGEYLTRAQVCDRYEGAQRPDLCLAYGNHYKPVGVIQRYAQSMRFAVMGYLADASETRYGGVLRSKMAYAGEHRFASPGFLKEDNTVSE